MESRGATAVFRALADELRLTLYETLTDGPATARDLASSVGLAADRLYHHLQILEDAGVITAEVRRREDGRAERLYAAVDVSIQDGDDPSAASELVSVLAARIATELRRGSLEDGVDLVSFKRLRLSDSARHDLRRDLLRLVEAYEKRSDPAAPPIRLATFAYEVRDDE